ncbi:MAG: Uma2 family endonuclease [Chloroflexaceae bacterium]|jgi:Uma2 family endonuclease|nr:Uma2 family endonuclease [Chloroflexaceae bacterium]
MTTTTFARPTELPEDILDWLPEQGHWSEEQYLWVSGNTNHLVEFTDGYLETLPWPTDHHQAISSDLFAALRLHMTQIGGKAYFAPLRLRIRPRKFREPDILLVRDANDPRRSNKFWTGADLVVEIVSPDRPERDLVEKRGDYAEGGIPEYWIVNPETQTITVLRLDGDAYVEHGVFGRGEMATSALLSGFSVSVDATLDAD